MVKKAAKAAKAGKVKRRAVGKGCATKRMPAPVAAATSEKVLCLRTCPADMVARGSHGSASWAFTWPRTGPVECPDWDPTPTCGHGLHGLLWGEGDWELLKVHGQRRREEKPDSVWMVVEVESADLVRIDTTKVKFRRGTVVFAGAKATAIVMVMAGEAAMKQAQQDARAWGEKSGDYSTAASSGDSSTAASSGNSSTAASSGNSSKAASSGNSSKAASSGDSSTAASSGNSSKAASSGYSSKAACDGASGVAAAIGSGGMAKAGPLGLVVVTYWSATEKRYRACVGNVGEAGILADTWYRVADGKLAVA
jgi:hypothetical protein